MTLVFDDSLLDDPDQLVATDTRGMLRSAAMAGAQTRAVAETSSEVGLEAALTGERPRAVILLARPGVAPAACRLLAALVGASSPVPVVLAETMPTWVGALDVVFAHTDDVGDSVLAESVALATRRGATVVLSGSDEGPVPDAAGGRATLLPPRLALPASLSLAHVLAAGAGVLAGLGLLSCDLQQMADELDGEAERAGPRRELVENPAKSLAVRLAEHTPLLWGLEPVSTAAGAHAAFALGVHAGIPCRAENYAQGASEHALYRSASSGDDVFADPGEGTRSPRVFLLGARFDLHAEAGEHAAVRALPGADVITPGEAVTDDALLRSALLATRFELAAIYVALASGTVGGPDHQALAVH